jgi:hypothetical protein
MASPTRSNEYVVLELLGAETGLPRTVREITTLVRVKCPSLLFLCETRNSEVRVSNLRWRLGLKNCIAVDSDGRSGSLALFWHESVEVDLIEKNFRYIDVSTRLSPLGPLVSDYFCLWGAAN